MITVNQKINDRDLRERICLDAISAVEMKSLEINRRAIRLGEISEWWLYDILQ